MTHAKPAPVLIALAALAAAALPATIALAQPRSSDAQTTRADRTSIAVTLYNSGIGLVRESRSVHLPAPGRARLFFRDVAPSIVAPSIALTTSPDPGDVDVIEQTYRYDVLSPDQLSRRAAGASVTLHRTQPGSGEVQRVHGQVLAGFGPPTPPVLRTDEGITFFSDFHAVGFANLPERWSGEPSLAWLLDVRRPGKKRIDVSYLAAGMSWSADYVLVLGRGTAPVATLVGWLTLRNQSGASFEQARIAVVAGKVHTVMPTPMPSRPTSRLKGADLAPGPPRATRSQLSEYHLYELPDATDLPDRSSKQVTFLVSTHLRPSMRYVVDRDPFWRGPDASLGATTFETAETELRFEVSENQGLGVPMPAGTIRTFMPDSRGVPQFVGQAAIAHTPRDETVVLRLGAVSDIRLSRKLMDRQSLGKLHKDTVVYQLRNATSRPVRVDVSERTGKLDHATLVATHPDARTTVFTLSVPAGGEVSWRAEYTEGWQ